MASLSCLVVSFAMFLVYTNLGYYDDLYDSGVYLESARMMVNGAHLYTTIFDSQPPLWLLLVYGSLRLLGTTCLAGQLLSATMGLLVVIIVLLVVRELSDWPGALVAATIVILSPLQLEAARTVSPEVPALAFAAAGMAYAMRYRRRGNRGLLGVASALIGASVLIKLLSLLVLPALALAIALRHVTLPRPNQFASAIMNDSLLMIGTLMAVIFCVVIFFEPARVWNQAVEFHWAARSAISADAIPRALTLLSQLFANDTVLSIALLFALVGFGSAREGMLIAGWIAVTTAGLLYHRPLFDHHLVVLIPPIAIASGMGWSPCWRALFETIRRTRHQRGVLEIATASLSIVVGISLALSLPIVAARQAARQVYSIQQPNANVADLKAAELITRFTGEHDAILTDAQGIAFIAGRDVPPELTDTSYVRIASGYLRTDDVIRAAEASNVQLFLSWTGRLALLPGISEWARMRFPYHLMLGGARELYSMRFIDPMDADSTISGF